jgi:O-antigen/teichoic acid export membrane protein
LLGLLLLCFIPSSISYIFGAFLLAQRQLNYLIAVGLIVLLLNLLGNYVLIPSMDVFSLAYIAIGTNTLLCVLYGVYSLHRLEQLSSPHIWKGLLYVFLALGVMWSVDLYFHNDLMAVLNYGVIWILVTLIFWRKSIMKLINE